MTSHFVVEHHVSETLGVRPGDKVTVTTTFIPLTENSTCSSRHVAFSLLAFRDLKFFFHKVEQRMPEYTKAAAYAVKNIFWVTHLLNALSFTSTGHHYTKLTQRNDQQMSDDTLIRIAEPSKSRPSGFWSEVMLGNGKRLCGHVAEDHSLSFFLKKKGLVHASRFQ